MRRIQISLAGGGPASRGSLAVEVVLSDGDLVATALIEGERDTARLAVAPTGDGPVVLVAREFFASGEIRERQWTDPGELVVVGVVEGLGRPTEVGRYDPSD
jgi:hypothetical protein